MPQLLDVLNGHLHRASLAAGNASCLVLLISAFSFVAAFRLLGRLFGEQRGNFLEGRVDSITPALLGYLVGGSFGGKVGRELARVGYSRNGISFQDPLVIGLGSEEVRGRILGRGTAREQGLNAGGDLRSQSRRDMD